MQLEKIKNKILPDLQSVQATINSNLFSNVSFVNFKCFFSEDIQKGKLIRSLLLLLIVKFFNYKGTQHIWFSAVLELIHFATLIHDDVVDQATLRRNCKTFNSVFGNTQAVLFGDFIYSRAFQMISLTKNLNIIKILANVTNVIAEGEILQLLSIKNFKITITQYMSVIEKKTAILFESAALIALDLCVITNHGQRKALQTYGKYVGLLYQLLDDLTDYTIPTTILGKHFFKDNKEGKVTLPLLLSFFSYVNFSKKKNIKNFIWDKTTYSMLKNLVFSLSKEAKKTLNILSSYDKSNLYFELLYELPDALILDKFSSYNFEVDEI